MSAGSLNRCPYVIHVLSVGAHSLVGRHQKGTKLYKVRWAQCGEDEDTWEPMSKTAPQLVTTYHQQPVAEVESNLQASSALSERDAPKSPGAPNRIRPRESAISPSAKSPAAKR